MAAAPRLVEPLLASPELALVDATLAAELRFGLKPPEENTRPPRRVFSEVLAASQTPERLVEAVLADEIAEPGSTVTEGNGSEEFVDVVEDATNESGCGSSLNPALPAPEPGAPDAVDATDATLRRIRERLLGGQYE